METYKIWANRMKKTPGDGVQSRGSADDADARVTYQNSGCLWLFDRLCNRAVTRGGGVQKRGHGLVKGVLNEGAAEADERDAGHNGNERNPSRPIL